MAVIETWFEQDLQKPVKVRYIDGNLFSHNGNGNRIGVIVTNNGEDSRALPPRNTLPSCRPFRRQSGRNRGHNL